MPTYQWTITLQTTTTTVPAQPDVQTAMNQLFKTTATQVTLAGPQSVDDGPGEGDSD